jgi:hypothetical protein
MTCQSTYGYVFSLYALQGGTKERTDMDDESVNKHLCSFRFTRELISKLRRVAILRKTSMTDVLERAIERLKEAPKK